MRVAWLLLFCIPVLAPPAPMGGEEMEASQVLKDPSEVAVAFPKFTVPPRIPVLEDNGYFPCSDCHDNDAQESNPTVRILEEDHDDLAFRHGSGRFWCLSCHDGENRDMLQLESGAKVGFDESHLLCGDCHYANQKDFFRGIHGKRIETWREPRRLTPCTECHNPHDPSIKPRKAQPPPLPRTGLRLPERTTHHRPVWEDPDRKDEHEGDHHDED